MNPQIEALQREAAADPRVILLGGGLPSPTQFPRGPLAGAFVRALKRHSAPALQYGWPEGLESLRAWVAARLRARGAGLGPEDVMITSGAQQAIAIAVQAICRPGDAIAVDAETYPGALELFRSRGLRPTVEPEGKGGSVPIAYAMPILTNPRGTSAGAAARAALVARGAPIIEDEAYADLRFDGPPGRPLLADARDTVWHVGTLSKTLCPGLRLGWLVPPPPSRARALRLKQDADLQANSLAQSIVDDYLAREDFDARLCHLRSFYRRRAARFAEALRRHLPGWSFRFPEGGFALWIELDEELDEMALLREAVAAGVSFDPGSLFRASRAAAPAALRLCFSMASGARLDEAARRLARARARASSAPRKAPG